MKYTFSQMVSISGVRPDTLRYYEQVGLIQIKRDDKGYRYFDDLDLRNIQFLKMFRNSGCSIEMCRKLLETESLDGFADIVDERLKQLHVEELKLSKQKELMEGYRHNIDLFNSNADNYRCLPDLYLIPNGTDEKLFADLCRLIPITRFYKRIIVNDVIKNEDGIALPAKEAEDLGISTEGLILLESRKYFSIVSKKDDESDFNLADMQKILELLNSKSLILDGDIIGNIICSKKEKDSISWYYQLNIPFIPD
ncbi:MAG: MerR family transcriptional regulator [Erysipelotrichaceae bacterium]